MKGLLSAGALAGMVVGQAAGEVLYAGVNSGILINLQTMEKPLTDYLSAGGEFAQQTLPGLFGVDYQFINETAIDFFLEAGVNTIRLPFLLVSRHICT